MDDVDVKPDVAQSPKEIALHYMKTLVEVAHESFLILGADLKVITANPIFYQTFQVTPGQTERRYVYDLGNGQWDIPALRSLLEKVLPQERIVKDYEVVHSFETIGEKTMQLNARQIDTVQLIVLAIEDISERKQLEKRLAEYTRELEVKVAERTKELADQLAQVESLNKTMVGREIKMMELKKRNEELEVKKA